MLTISTKAQTLSDLSPYIQSATVLPLFTISHKQWEENPDSCLHAFEQLEWSQNKLIVRSSSVHEDRPGMSLAGRFLSQLNIEGKESLVKAIQKVMQSYDIEDSSNQVFIQPLLQDVKFSGVAFTKIPSSGAPYYLLNYDDLSGKTNTVTSGTTTKIKTFYCHRSYEPYEHPLLQQVILMLKELEEIFQSNALDVEFAMTPNNSLIIFQVRPLEILYVKQYPKNLQGLAKRVKNSMKRHSKLLGKKTIYGIMPDWNPAEMIGRSPKPLALSLYQELITDHIYAEQRYYYGYRDLRGVPLLIHFSGQPYIDVRASFNSFIPRDISHELSEKIVNHYLTTLEQFPTYHDKVEFEIVFSCFTFDLQDRLEAEFKDLSLEEASIFYESLRNLTNKIIHPDRGLWKRDLKIIEILERKNQEILNSSKDPLTKIYWLLEDCKKFGTLPFAGLARSAFIAMSILRSLQTIGILSKDDYYRFLNSLSTVGSELTDDLHTLKKTAFLEKYGHLRPGTYDILFKRYDEAPDDYFDFSKAYSPPQENHPFYLSPEQEKRIQDLLKKNQIEHTASSLMMFIAEAIKGREYAKFIFSKNISAVLKLITEYGSAHNLSREDCAFFDIKTILKLYYPAENTHKPLHLSIQQGKSRYARTLLLHLPPLIFDEKEIFAFHLPHNEPTFITLKRIQAKSACIQEDDLEGKIIFIPSADPGYDWIFTKLIAGFVTMYGGANSHMAIRAAEHNLPAIIGTGEVLYHLWKNSQRLDVDCANKKVTLIK